MFSRIVITAAMESEIGFIRRAIDPPDRTRRKFAVGTLGSKTLMLLRTGVGPRKALQRLEEVTELRDAQCVISIGCAGSLHRDVKVGDVVVSEKIIDLTAERQTYCPRPELVAGAKACCERLHIPFHLGATVTASDVAATPDDKRTLGEAHGALAVDMETAQVAAWAQGHGLPMLSIRTISDGLTDRIPPEIALVVGPQGRLRLGRAAALFVRRPRLFIEIVRLKRKLDRCLRTLEKVVLELIRRV